MTKSCSVALLIDRLLIRSGPALGMFMRCTKPEDLENCSIMYGVYSDDSTNTSHHCILVRCITEHQVKYVANAIATCEVTSKLPQLYRGTLDPDNISNIEFLECLRIDAKGSLVETDWSKQNTETCKRAGWIKSRSIFEEAEELNNRFMSYCNKAQELEKEEKYLEALDQYEKALEFGSTKDNYFWNCIYHLLVTANVKNAYDLINSHSLKKVRGALINNSS